MKQRHLLAMGMVSREVQGVELLVAELLTEGKQPPLC